MTVHDFQQYDFGYYATSVGAGAIGTCITHTAMTVRLYLSIYLSFFLSISRART